MNIPETLKALAATDSSNEKKRILKETRSELLAKVFNAAYNHFITYGVHKLDTSDVKHVQHIDATEWFARYFVLLAQLSSRLVTGNAAKEAILELMNESTEEYGELLMNTLKKDLRIGAGTRVINSVYPGLLPDDFCMSAMKYDPKRVSFPVYVDTKLDGIRCITVREGVELKLYSRNMKEFRNYPTIAEELKKLNLDVRFDGEITMGHFQNLMRTLSRKEDGIELAKDAVYNIFDVMDTTKTFRERLASLDDIKKRIDQLELTHLRIVTHRYADDENELKAFYTSQLEAGQEGIMVKDLGAMYEFKRSYSWMKMKPCNDIDIRIVSVQEGLGKYTNMLGAFICELPNANIVQVGSGLTEVERQEFWKNKDTLIGRMIEVKYQEFTLEGTLRFPVFKRFRNDKE